MKMKTLLKRSSIPVIKEFPLIVLLMLFSYGVFRSRLQKKRIFY